MATLTDMLAFCKRQARIESINYVDPWAQGETRAQMLSAWRRDCRLRNQDRLACFAAFPGRLRKGTEPLEPGSYGYQGRLTVSPAGEIDYTPGIYAPREIYQALLSYLTATN